MENAVPLFKKLVEKQYRPEETLPALLNILIAQKKYDEADIYIAGLSESEKDKWREKISRSKSHRPGPSLMSKEFRIAESSKDTDSLVKLTDKYRQRLDRCIEPDVFFKAAGTLKSEGSIKEAERIYGKLLSACRSKWDLRVGILYELKSTLDYSEMIKLVDAEMKRDDLPSGYRQQIRELRTYVLKDRISVIPFKSEEAVTIAEEILSADPDDPDALSVIGWRDFERKDYKTAHEIFKRLHERYPENSDYTEGLIYVLIEMNDYQNALALLNESEMKKEKKEKLESSIYLKEGGALYEAKDYAGAEPFLKRALALDPGNRDAEALLAWSLYNQNNIEEALVLFTSLYEQDKDADFAEAILNAYERTGRRREAVEFSLELGRTSDESLQSVSGNYFSAHGMPVTAAQVDPDPKAPYYNADKPYFSSSPSFRHKSGDSGISELNDIAIPVSFLYPHKWGNEFGLSLTTHWLYSGDVPSSPFVGTAPDGGAKKRDLVNSVWVFTPEITYESEGYIDYDIALGLTPLNGPLYSLPTFFIGAGQEHWRLNVHQNSVTESILSYVGLDDPYSSREWGRVLQTGAEGEINLTPFPSYWFSLSGGYDYYWGKNVEGNNAVYGTVSIGRTFKKNPVDISLGLFFTTQHFENNSNFFTFGHGGYFSPDIFLMTGPTLGITTNTFKSYWLEAQGSVGYLYFREESSPFLTVGGNNSDGGFKGQTSSQIGFNVDMETLKLVTPHTAVGVYGDVNKSADFTEWSAGLTLRYYLSPRVGLVSDPQTGPY